jgi:hypothetical protein
MDIEPKKAPTDQSPFMRARMNNPRNGMVKLILLLKSDRSVHGISGVDDDSFFLIHKTRRPQMMSTRTWRPPFSRAHNLYIRSTHPIPEELPQTVDWSRSILILQPERPAGPYPSGRPRSGRYIFTSLGSTDVFDNRILVRVVTSYTDPDSLMTWWTSYS